jgi:hypothetical protein
MAFCYPDKGRLAAIGPVLAKACSEYVHRLQAPPVMPRRDIGKDRLPGCAILSFLSLDKLV